jgi:hypothetical protein
MSGVLLYLLIGFAVQTVILLGLLWGMIKIQKIDQRFEYKFLGLVGAAALATGLDQILQAVLGHFIGLYLASYISTPIVVATLLFCVKKVTHAPYVDVLFTVAISYALLFGVNLFILGSLMGDLRPAAKNPDEFETVAQQQETGKQNQPAVQPPVVKTNLPVPKAVPPPSPAKTTPAIVPTTNPPVLTAPAAAVKPAEKIAPKTNPPAPVVAASSVKPVAASVPATNLPAPAASTNLAKSPEAAVANTNPPAVSVPTNATPPLPPAKPIEVLIKYFSVRGVTENGANSAVTIQCGTKIYTIFLGETALTQTPDGPIPVSFKKLAAGWVDLEINGQPAKLPIY